MVYVGCLDTKERHSRNQSRSRGGPKDKLTISQSRIFSPWNANYFFIDCFHVQFVHVLGKEEMENVNVVCFFAWQIDPYWGSCAQGSASIPISNLLLAYLSSFGFFDHWCAVIRQIWHGWMALLVAESLFCLMKCSNCGGNVLGWQTRNFLPSLHFDTVCVSNNTEHSNNFMLWTCGIVQQFSWLLTDILASTWKLYAHCPSFYIWIFVSSLCLVVDSQVGTY